MARASRGEVQLRRAPSTAERRVKCTGGMNARIASSVLSPASLASRALWSCPMKRTAPDMMVPGDVPAALEDAADNLGGKHLWANSEMRRLLHASWETSRTELSQSEAVTLVRALLNRNRA